VSSLAKQTTKPTGGLKTFLRLLSYARPYAPWMIIGIVLLTADVCFSVAIAWVQETFLDTIDSGDVDRLMFLVRVSALVSACAMALMVAGALIRYWTVTLMDRDLAVAAYDHVNRLPFGYVESVHSGDLVARASSDIGQAIQVAGNSAFSLIHNMGICLLAFFYLSDIDLPLALLAVAGGPLVFLTGRFFDSRIRKLSKEIQDQNAHLRGILQEMFQGMPVVKAFCLEGSFAAKYEEERTAATDMFKRRSLLNAFMWRSVSFINLAFLITCTGLIALASIRGTLSVGAVLAFTILMGRVQWPFTNLSTTWGQVQQGLGAADRVFAMMDTATETSTVGDSGDRVLKFAGSRESVLVGSRVFESAGSRVYQSAGSRALGSPYALEVDGITFSYEENSGEALFKDLSLKIKPGELVALVGPSGGGKTTLAQICCGLREFEQGDVRVFGVSFRENLDAARSYIAYVPQTPYLFAGTLEENIAYGREGATMDEIIEAAKAANAHDFIMALENQYKTTIGEHGTSLSGGERQRIAIARAFLRDAPLIILDEATSSLDNESEKLVQESMDRLLEGRTALVIAHRLSTVRNASRILVMDGGRIAEEGTHEELMRKNGLYARLHAIQFRE
jgi:ATP-binding cassette subfamily B protein